MALKAVKVSGHAKLASGVSGKDEISAVVSWAAGAQSVSAFPLIQSSVFEIFG
jgi:hypothetical protein